MTLSMLAAALMPVAAQADAADGVTVTVAVTGLRNTKGLIRACLTADPKTFPDCDKDPHALRATVPAHNGPVVVFRHVAPGGYAVSLFHDENSNGRLDKTMGVPNEGYGFSRNAPVMFGPPHFSAARVEIGASDMTLPVKVRYIL
jgi:uncharacterized protein (DUF2141 family)